MIDVFNKVAGIILILLSISVSVPLTIRTFLEGGGPWGFGIIGLPVLIPLNACVLFGIAGMATPELSQRRIFIGAYALTLIVGVIGVFIFPVYPLFLALLPPILATLGVVYKAYYKYCLLIMILLAVVANAMLLKWELDFDRTLPLLQLFHRTGNLDP